MPQPRQGELVLPPAPGWRGGQPGRQEPTSRTRRGDLPGRHRAEDPERAEAAGHRRGRGTQPSAARTSRHGEPSALGTAGSTPARRAT